MRKKSMHVVLVASVLIFSSIAGCLATDEENDVEKATIVVSTYHVEQLVSAINMIPKAEPAIKTNVGTFVSTKIVLPIMIVAD